MTIKKVVKQEEILDGLKLGLDMFPMSVFWETCDYFHTNGQRHWVMMVYIVFLHAVGFTFCLFGFAAVFVVDMDIQRGTAAIMNPICGLQTVFKCWSFSYSTAEYIGLFKFLRKDFLSCIPKSKEKAAEEITKRNVDATNTFVKYAMRWNMLTLFMISTMPFLRSQYVRESLHIGVGPIYPNKICENEYPFDWNSSPVYEIVFVYEQIAVILAVVTSGVYQAILLYLVMAIVTHLEVLGHVVNTLKVSDYMNVKGSKPTPEAKAEAYQQLIECIKDHQKLVQAGDDLAERYNTFLTFHLGSAIIVVIIATFNFSAADSGVDKVKFMTMCVYGLLEVALYCYCGQLLENASEDLYKRVYNCEWEDFDPDFRKCAQLMMIRSNKPLCLLAGRLYRVNLETLGRIQQLVYSALSVLTGAGS